jgi:hypothetical protein
MSVDAKSAKSTNALFLFVAHRIVQLEHGSWPEQLTQQQPA